MKTWCCILAGVLAVVIVGFGYRFLVTGNVGETLDGRQTIIVNASERELILAEMRDFLLAGQQITAAIADNQPRAAAAAARRVGAQARRAVPDSLMIKLPLGFKRLGFDTHARFDRLAMDAADLGDRTVILRQLGELMNNCVACHAAYRLRAGPREPLSEPNS